MTRHGYRIIDADTHVGPVAEILMQHLTAHQQAKLTSRAPYKVVQRRTGHVTCTRGSRAYRRRLGLADADTSAASTGYMAGFAGVYKGQEPSPLVDADPAARITGVILVSARHSAWPGGHRRLSQQALALGALRLCPLCHAVGPRPSGALLENRRGV